MSLPVLIISFRRILNVLRLIDGLHNQGVEKIYLAIDGARENDDDSQSQIEIQARSRAAELNIDLKVWRRDSNLGPAVSVITAIDWLFLNEERGVIIEDDLVLSSDAIKYFDVTLLQYSQNKKVFMITGSNFFDGIIPPTASVISTHYPVVWGWATWRDRWFDYRSALSSLQSMRIQGSSFERRYWNTGLRRCLNGVKDAWDIPLVTYQRTHNFLTVLPPVNLVSNIGFDAFAGNTFIDEWPLNSRLGQLSPTAMINIRSQDIGSEPKICTYVDELFRERVYRINGFRTLPSKLSTIFDIIRYPRYRRAKNLIDRLSEIVLP